MIRWVENLLRPALIAAMMVCLAAPAVRLLEGLLGGWDGAYFLVFLFVAGLEGILSERILQGRRVGGYGYLSSRAAELLILLILLKLAAYVPLGLDRLWADVRLWSADPDLFVTPADLATGMLFLLLWAGAIYVARMARELDAEEAVDPPPADRTSSEYYLWLTQPSPARESQQALVWLGQTWLWGGIALLLASLALTLLTPDAAGVEIPVLLYFGLGLALLTQGRFSVAHIGWRMQGMAIQKGIGRRWLLWSVLFLTAVSLAALLLPTEYTMGPVRAILGFLSLAFAVLSAVLTFLWFLLLLPLSLLFPQLQPMERPVLPGVLPTPGDVASQGSTSSWLQVTASALFWLVMLAIVGYAITRFIRDRWKGTAEGEAGPLWWVQFLDWLRRIWREWRVWRRVVSAQIERRLARQRTGPEESLAGRRFLSLRRLSPRELVRYFYLSTVRRAQAAGLSRPAGQTPYEYRAELDRLVPDLEPHLEGLTEAFVHARYSPRPVAAADAEEVKPLWQRIKTVLRRRRMVGS